MNLWKVTFFFLCLSGFFSLSVHSQEEQWNNQKEKNRDSMLLLLEKETRAQSDKGHKTTDFSTLVPERLPEWLNQIPLSKGNKIYLLGISDPGMDKEKGLKIAKLRMKIIYSLIANSEVSNMRDFYIREKQDGYANAFIDYTGLNNKIEAGLDDFEIIESHVTKYDETILLGKIDIRNSKSANKKADQLTTSAGILSNARRIGPSTEMISKINLDSEFKPAALSEKIQLSYEAYAINRRINTETTFNEDTISCLPALNLRYSIDDQHDYDTLNVDQTSFSLRNGIWYAYLTAIFFELTDMAHGSAVNLANINEIFDNFAQNLTREIVTSSVKCNQKRIMIQSNNLYLKCD